MSYPSGPPGNSGYQPAQSAPQYGAPSPQYEAPQEPVPAGPSKLPLYLDAGVAALGLAIYFTTFGLGGDVLIGVLAGVLAGLLAGAGLLPKQKSHYGVVAVLATLGLLLIILTVVSAGASVDWPAYLLLVFSALQALVAIGALLLDAEVISVPEPKPHYDQGYGGQYGAPGGYYGQQPQDYGQPQGPPQHGGPPQQGPPQQRPAYTQVTQYGGYSNAPTTGGFAQSPSPTSVISTTGSNAQNHGQNNDQNGPPTPPTGFPAFGQPHQTGSTPLHQSGTTDLTKSFDTQQPQQQAAPPSPPPPS